MAIRGGGKWEGNIGVSDPSPARPWSERLQEKSKGGVTQASRPGDFDQKKGLADPLARIESVR